MTRHPVAFVALGLSACASATTQVPTARQFDVRAGDALQLTGSSTVISLVSIADSRCPVDVQCISAGDAIVAVRFSGDAGARSDTLRLTAAPRAVRYGSQRLELLDVRPLPRSTDQHRVSTAVLQVTSAP